ncbi:anterior gradient protein 3-like [Scleropages formosus]|uniref:Anterior gradient protein 3-like n=1 Tax=Scleropages formosus TaxID=113540 RepID=A0A0P7TN92_SCLFO|nr:anterior gradient protein 3-like [Scleropages formosus]
MRLLTQLPQRCLFSGWGDEITWVQTYEEGLTKMKQSQKPLMVIHHKEDCPYSQGINVLGERIRVVSPVRCRGTAGLAGLCGDCFRLCCGETWYFHSKTVDIVAHSALKKAFAADKAVQKMAQEDFVMLNVVHETWDKHLASDGTYVPRIVFVDPSMKVRVDIVGKYGNRLYAYQADNVDTLLKNMKKAKVLLHNEL